MKSKKRWVILGVIALVLVGLLVGLWAGLEGRYQAALNTQSPRQALPRFEKLGSYRDSRAQAEALRKEIALLDAREAEACIAQAQALAVGYDYTGALSLLEAYCGDRNVHPEIDALAQTLAQEQAALVAWEDPEQVLSLGVQTLIADETRAYGDPLLGEIMQADCLTTGQFSQILSKLYDRGYVLVNLRHIYTEAYGPKTVWLPQGKKPLLLTQLGVNYYTSLVDSDRDLVPDKGGKGFAHRLEVTQEGTLTCAYTDGSGSSQTGAYDLVPILEEFIAQHPDFSYQGARALLAVTGFDGLFGYRTDPQTAALLGMEYYENQCWGAYRTAQALKRSGYELACYSYGNLPCATASRKNIQEDLALWAQYITPIVGELTAYVCPQYQQIPQENAALFHEAGFQLLMTCSRDSDAQLQLLAPSTLEQIQSLK